MILQSILLVSYSHNNSVVFLPSKDVIYYTIYYYYYLVSEGHSRLFRKYLLENLVKFTKMPILLMTGGIKYVCEIFATFNQHDFVFID